MSDLMIENLIGDQGIMDKLALCMDREFRHIKYWIHWARHLKIPPQIIEKCALRKEYSPTQRLFEFLKATNPDMTVKELMRGLENISHNDCCRLIETYNLRVEDNVAKNITSSASEILDELALKLDAAAMGPVGNWQDLALQLGVARDKCQRFQMYISNPTRLLFQYLATIRRDLTVGEVIKNLSEMIRINIVQIIQQEKFEDSALFHEAICLDSQLFDEISGCLNKDVAGLGGWRMLGSRLGVPSDALDSMEPTSANHSSTKSMLDWLAKSKPETTLQDLIGGLNAIRRNDAEEIIGQLDELTESLSNIALGFDSHGISDVVKVKKVPTTSTEPESSADIQVSVAIPVTMDQDYGESNQQFRYNSTLPVDVPVPETASTSGKSREIHISVSVPVPARHRFNSKSNKMLPKLTHEPEGTEASSYPPSYGLQETTGSDDHHTQPTARATRPSNLPKKPRHLYARDEEKTLIHSSITNKECDVIEVFAPTGYGKTSLVVTIARELIELRWTVLYVNCRHVQSVDALAVKIIEEIIRGVCTSSDPTAHALYAIKTLVQNTVLVIENFDELIHLQRPQRARPESPDSDFPCHIKPENKVGPIEFVIMLAQCHSSCQFCLVLTSRERVDFSGVETEPVELKAFNARETLDFLMQRTRERGTSLDESTAESIAGKCCGIPLLIDIVLNVLKTEDAIAFKDRLSSSSPHETMRRFCFPTQSPEQRIDHCLNACFDRMDQDLQDAFVMSSVFPGPFTVDLAAKILTTQRRVDSLWVLKYKHCFISYNRDSSMYIIHSVFRSFGLEKAKDIPKFSEKYNIARLNFVDQILSMLKSLDRDFYNVKSQSAIARYRKERPNIDQVLQWCVLDSDFDDNDLQLKVIDVFLEVGIFIAKVMRRVEFEQLYCRMYHLCVGHEARLSDEVRDIATSRSSSTRDIATSRSSSTRDMNTSRSSSTRDMNTSRSSSTRDMNTSRSSSTRNMNTSRSSSTRDMNTSRSSSTRDMNTSRSSSTRDMNTSRSSSTRDMNTSRPSWTGDIAMSCHVTGKAPFKSTCVTDEVRSSATRVTNEARSKSNIDTQSNATDNAQSSVAVAAPSGVSNKARSSACLVYIGTKILLSCLCEPAFCPTAQKRAFHCLQKANEIQTTSGILSGEVRAQCLSKLGRCLVRKGEWEEGFRMINEALQIRKGSGYATSTMENQTIEKYQVMLAAVHNDLAAAESYRHGQQDNTRAIEIRLKHVLPVYQRTLGGHPFTATAHSLIANNYLEIGNYGKAIEYSLKALECRQQLLGDHQETARSLFDLGSTYLEKGELDVAVKHLEHAQTMQHRVMDTPEELVKTLQKLHEAYTRLGDSPKAGLQMYKINLLAPKQQAPIDPQV